MEIELKLVGAAQDIARLGRLPFLRAAQRSRAVTKQLHSVYFDTPDHDLARRDMALRLRRVGTRWIQTFKCGGAVDAGLHQRHEFEAPTAAQLLNVPALMDTPASDLFRDDSFRAQLAPVFVTDFRRTRRIVEVGPGTTAELAVDVGFITVEDRSVPIHEIEIELLQGDAAHLLAFAHALVDALPLRLENASKAERGYALQARREARPARAAKPALDTGMSPSEGLQSIVSSCLGQLLANDRGILESDDPEYIHQARVAIRRLRSAFSLFRPMVPRESMADLLERFRELAEAFGEARDRDVFLLETLPPVLAAFGDSAALARLRDHAIASASAARAAARRAGSESAYAHLLLDMVERMRARPWEAVPRAESETAPATDIPTTMKALAARLLQRQYKRVKRRGATADRRDPQSLHALRIEIKKLRYAAEFFSALFPAKAVRRFVAGSTEVQDILGRLNDESVTDALLQSLDLADAEMSHAGGIIRGWTHARAEAGLARFDKAWRTFARLDRFW